MYFLLCFLFCDCLLPFVFSLLSSSYFCFRISVFLPRAANRSTTRTWSWTPSWVRWYCSATPTSGRSSTRFTSVTRETAKTTTFQARSLCALSPPPLSPTSDAILLNRYDQHWTPFSLAHHSCSSFLIQPLLELTVFFSTFPSCCVSSCFPCFHLLQHLISASFCGVFEGFISISGCKVSVDSIWGFWLSLNTFLPKLSII